MKVDELRGLEADELSGRLRAARRELYELRFKHAVGQLENTSQIFKVRHDIARIMTVLSERALGLVQAPQPAAGEVEAVAVAAPAAASDLEPQAVAAPAAKPRAGRKTKITEETS
jgi:large subunit ribosomal protein L29